MLTNASPANETFDRVEISTAENAKSRMEQFEHRNDEQNIEKLSKEFYNTLTAGEVSANAEALLPVEKNGEVSGIVLSAQSVSISGKEYKTDFESFEYVPTSDVGFTAVSINKPIDTVKILPDQSTFTDSIEVSFNIPTQNTSDIEYYYTTDGSDPTLDSEEYIGPFTLSDSAFVKVRPFRKDLDGTPWNIPSVDAGRTISAIFKKAIPLPPLSIDGLRNGLSYRYYEDTWSKLFTYAGIEGILNAKSQGVTEALLDGADLQKIRKTDRAFAVSYDGYINVPETGVYVLKLEPTPYQDQF